MGLDSCYKLDANYIDGADRSKAFIATAVPSSPSAFAHFWSMVWESHCCVVVSMSPPVECGQQKCERYWPPAGSTEGYGHVKVANMGHEDVRANYTVKKFKIWSTRWLIRLD